MASDVRIWSWKTRAIKPPLKEEYTTYFTTRGELMGFQHLINEADPGASLSKTEARAIGEVFLRTERRINLDKYHLVEDALVTRPKRLDYTLTWKRTISTPRKPRIASPSRFKATKSAACMSS